MDFEGGDSGHDQTGLGDSDYGEESGAKESEEESEGGLTKETIRSKVAEFFDKHGLEDSSDTSDEMIEEFEAGEIESLSDLETMLDGVLEYKDEVKDEEEGNLEVPEEEAYTSEAPETIEDTKPPEMDEVPEVPVVNRRRARKLNKTDVQSEIDSYFKEIKDKYKGKKSADSDKVLSEFRKNLFRNGITNEDGKIKGKGKKSAFTAQDLEQKLELSKKEADESFSASEREKKVKNAFAGNINSIDLVSEKGEIYLRTTPVKGNSTKFSLNQEGDIATAVREAQSIGKPSGESALLKALNAFSDVPGGLKDSVINIISVEYIKQMNTGTLPNESRKKVNLSDFNVTDVVGVFDEQIDITPEEREKYKNLKLDYAEFATQPKRQKGILRKLLTMSGKLNYEDAIAHLEPIYGTKDESLEEVFKVSRDLLRRLLA